MNACVHKHDLNTCYHTVTVTDNLFKLNTSTATGLLRTLSAGGYPGEWSPLRRGDCRLEPGESESALDDIVEIHSAALSGLALLCLPREVCPSTRVVAQVALPDCFLRCIHFAFQTVPGREGSRRSQVGKGHDIVEIQTVQVGKGFPLYHAEQSWVSEQHMLSRL
jgi:hypothetical protein